MKKTSKILALLLAFVMAFAVVAPAVNAQDVAPTKTTKVTLHKILMTKSNLDNSVFPGTTGINKEEYKGGQIQNIQGYFGADSKEIDGVFFAVQNKDGKYVDKSGKALDDQSITSEDFKTSVLGGFTKDGGLELDTSNLPQDKATEYKIVEIVELSTYKGEDGSLLAGQKAVPVVITLPLVNDNGVVAEAHVYPKNTEEKPQIDKNFKKDHGLTVLEDKGSNNNVGADYKNYQAEKALVSAELGKTVPYEVKTKVNAGSRYQTLNWKDTMSNGLTFTKDSLNITTTPDLQLAQGDYKLTQDDRGFTLSLTTSGFEKLNKVTHPENGGTGQDVEFTLTYSATVNKNAVVDMPEKNDIKLEYSNDKSTEKEPTPVTPSNGQLSVSKTWSNGDVNTAPDNVQVVYTLTKGDKSVAVMLDKSTAINKVFDLGNGITFTVTGEFAGTFKGLGEETTGWTLSERVAGWDETIDGNTAGSASITNKKDNDNPEPLNPTEPKVEYHGKKFVKADKDTGARLEGAEFVVSKDVNGATKYLALKSTANTNEEREALTNAKKSYTDWIDAWNKAVKENPTETEDNISVTVDQETITGKTQVLAKIAALKEAYDNAFYAAANAYEWVDTKGSALVLISDVQGKFEIKGLEKGTYKLEETKAPEGYALPSNTEFEFTVDNGTYGAENGGVKYAGDETVNDTTGGAMRIDNKKVSIPQTGGIGTVIFTVVGIVMMTAAGFVLVKNNKKEELA